MKEENLAIIKALNMYGRVPEQWELLNEIERLKEDNKYLNKVNIELSSEKNRLRFIIKEVREELNKIDSATYQGDTDKKTYYKYEQTRIQKLLEILDKANKEE